MCHKAEPSSGGSAPFLLGSIRLCASQPRALGSQAMKGEEVRGSEGHCKKLMTPVLTALSLEGPKSLLSRAFISGLTHSGSFCPAPGVRQSGTLGRQENVH